MTETLSKQAFYQELSRGLGPHWKRMPGPIDMTALFAKRADDLILSLAFDESQLYRERVTAELTLGGHAFAAMTFPDAPRARSRVGELLLAEERVVLLDPLDCRPGVVDAWWRGRTQENVAKMIEAIRLAEPRFLARPGLREELARSERHAAHVARQNAIAATPLPQAAKYKIPPDEWIETAYSLLTNAHPKYGRAFAAKLAADAWRVHRILASKP